MRVAFFIGSLNRGGTEMLTLDIFAKRAVAPFDMILIYRNDGELTEAFKTTGVPMFRLKPNGNKVGYIVQLRRLLKDEKVDILHAQTFTNALAGIVCTKLSKTRLVFTFHGLFSSKKTVVKRHLIMWNADALTFVSKYVQDWYGARSICDKHRWHVVYNGVNFDKINDIYPIPDFLQSVEPINGVIKLAMVGNFVSGRSQMVVCKGLRLLKGSNIDFMFFFVGKKSKESPQLYDECVEYCEEYNLMDCVSFVGGRGDVPAILQQMDGFVYSTVRDTFGIAVIEAISAGVPAVLNDWPVMKEISLGCESVAFFESGNEKDCCEQMRQLIANIKARKEKAVRDATNVIRKYSIENHIGAMSKVYKEVLKNQS